MSELTPSKADLHHDLGIVSLAAYPDEAPVLAAHLRLSAAIDELATLRDQSASLDEWRNRAKEQRLRAEAAEAELMALRADNERLQRALTSSVRDFHHYQEAYGRAMNLIAEQRALLGEGVLGQMAAEALADDAAGLTRDLDELLGDGAGYAPS